MGDEQSTGRFVTGKSVPRSRPTMFWQPQVLDLKFDYQSYMQKKEERFQAHDAKIKRQHNLQDKILAEIDEIQQ